MSEIPQDPSAQNDPPPQPYTPPPPPPPPMSEPGPAYGAQTPAYGAQAQALNFQIIIAIAYFVSSLLIFVVIGFITYPLAFIISVIFSIMAAMAANKGEEYTYPMVPQMVT